MPLYIEKINGDVDQPTDQQGEYRAIYLFRKLENRKKAEICNLKHLVWLVAPLYIEGSPLDEGVDQGLLVLASLLHHRCQLFKSKFQLLCQHQESCLQQSSSV